MMVKICGITNREDALAAVEGGASALGFNFYPRSPRCLDRDAARRIVEAVPQGVWRVGVFVNEAPERVAEVAGDLALDVVQIHGDSARCPDGLRAWRAVRVGPGFDPSQLEAGAFEAYLLDTASENLYGGTGRCFDWRVARGVPQKVIVAGGLDETNVREAIEQARPWGVDACSRLESAPGRKDRDKMARFLKTALAAADEVR